jgi:hypothetical protein
MKNKKPKYTNKKVTEDVLVYIKITEVNRDIKLRTGFNLEYQTKITYPF